MNPYDYKNMESLESFTYDFLQMCLSTAGFVRNPIQKKKDIEPPAQGASVPSSGTRAGKARHVKLKFAIPFGIKDRNILVFETKQIVP